MKVVDITSLLHSALSTEAQFHEKNLIFFNPSIAYYNDTYYILTARVLTRGGIPPEVNTPWLGGPRSSLWWDKEFDMTVVFLINKRDVIGPGHGAGIIYLGSVRAEDVRITNLTKMRQEYSQTFLLTGSVYIQNADVSIKEEGSCEQGCTLMEMVILNVNNNPMHVEKVSEAFLCPEKSESIEKNWAPWQAIEDDPDNPHNRQNTFISYKISNDHVFFSVHYNINAQTLTCLEEYTIENKIRFGDFTEYYSSRPPISLSTPIVIWNKNSDGLSMLGVGHIKFRHDEIEPESPLGEFYRETFRYKRKHPELIYMFFFFEVNFGYYPGIPNGSIVRASPMLHLNYYDSSLTFPSGFCSVSPNDNDNFVMSAGIMDERAMLVYFTRADIERLLLENDQLNLAEGGIHRIINLPSENI